MKGLTPTSISRYRPAILILSGAAAAYAAWLLYTSVRDAPPEGLHRSNAIRRPNQRVRRRTTGSARIVRRLQQDSAPLGEFEFFGRHVELDARNVLSADALREMARDSQPTASPEMVDDRIGQLYDTLLDRLIGLAFPDRPMSAAEETAVTRVVGEQDALHDSVMRALQRHRNRFALLETEAVLAADGTESIAPTELSWRSNEDIEGGFDSEGQTLQRTLYHIAEDRAKHEGVIHRGITCNSCGNKPIRGIRWRCANCPDYDLCSDCEANNSHIKTHIFYKVRVPAPYLGMPKQEPVYPGRPYLMSPSVNSAIRKRLVEETRMEAEEIEALWDQFTCLATTEWASDPNEIGWALDRRAFNHAFLPKYSSFATAPNLVFDRVFAYLDTDRNTLIGFEELVKGLDKLHSTDIDVKLRISFNGYDIDGDGYISRKDVLRIFRAHYAIEKEATRNYLAQTAEELSVRGALETIHSGQPLGSAFAQHNPPSDGHHDERLRGKDADAEIDHSPMVDDVPDTVGRDTVIRQAKARAPNTVGQSDPDLAVSYRWARRQFYTDEEEGFARPEGAEDDPLPDELQEQTDRGTGVGPNLEYEHARESRSSSRVRFQDDVDMETRSNASTSSRPIGERWGGYELPEPEKDLGKEVLYQITQQAFNELLDPLFKEGEDNAMDAFATRAERRACAPQIDSLLEEFEREKPINRSIAMLGPWLYASFVIESFVQSDITELFRGTPTAPFSKEALAKVVQSRFNVAEHAYVEATKPSWNSKWQPECLHMWNAKLCRVKLAMELGKTFEELVLHYQWLSVLPSSPSSSSLGIEAASSELIVVAAYRDPTLPQFRPNSLADLVTTESEPEGGASSGFEDEGNPPTDNKPDAASLFVKFHPLNEVAINGNDDHGQDDNGSVDSNEAIAPSPPDESKPPARSLDAISTRLALGEPSDSKTYQPTIHCVDVDPTTSMLRAYAWGVDHALDWEPMLRFEALKSVGSPLHLPFLASLEAVEKEISERKGSGLLNFEEFGAHVRYGTLRFLQSWMDWVSF